MLHPISQHGRRRNAVRWTAIVVCAIALIGGLAPTLRAQTQRGRCRPELRPGGAVDVAEGGKLVFDTTRDAALARDERSVLVRLPDARRPAVLVRRSDEEDQGAALRSREDGGDADLDHAHPVRRAAPALSRPCAS